jgi:Arc/MetJ-type ribon-helix-helix transcriptional regulator
METLQIRLPKPIVQLLDRTIQKGLYKSRSEAIRDSLERMAFLSALDNIGNIIQEEGAKKEDLLRELKNIRKEVYKKYL